MKRITYIWLALLIGIVSTLACSAPSLSSLRPEPTETPRPTRTQRPTFTPTPTDTATPPPTSTPTRTATPTATRTPLPTNTPPPTDTPRPTNTPRPIIPTATFTPAPPPPTATPADEFTGSVLPPIAASYSCSVSYVAVRVVDRNGKPLPGYIVHIGQDGDWSKWTEKTTATAKEPFGHNADYNFYSSGQLTIYVMVFREQTDPFNRGAAISNEVTAYVQEKDEEACSASDNKSNGSKVRIPVVQFVYNR